MVYELSHRGESETIPGKLFLGKIENVGNQIRLRVC